MSGAIMHPAAYMHTEGEAPPGEWTGKDYYEFFQQNREARLTDDEQGDAIFAKIKEYQKTKSNDYFAGIGDALGMLTHELSGLLKAPKTLFDKDKSLALSAAEGGLRGARFIPSIFWESEDPSSLLFGIKSWTRALVGEDDGDVRAQRRQWQIAREWNNRTYDYMEGKATILGDLDEKHAAFYNRMVDTEFATGFSWIAMDVPSWFLSGGATSVAEGAKLSAMASRGVGAADKMKRASYLASVSNRLSEFGTKMAGHTMEFTGSMIQKPFQLAYGSRAAAEGIAGTAAAEALHNVAQSQIMAGARVLSDGMVHSPGIGIFRSLGIEAIGELVQAAGTELIDRAAGVVPINQTTMGMTVLQKLATNTASRTQGLLSKEAQAIAKGLNFTVGWVPGMSASTFKGGANSALWGGLIGYAHSPDATGGGIGIGLGMGLGHSSLRHLYAMHTFSHTDRANVDAFGKIGIKRIAEMHGDEAANMARSFHEHGMSMLEKNPNYLKGLSTDVMELTRTLGDPNVSISGKVEFFFGDAKTEAGQKSLINWLMNRKNEKGELVFPETELGKRQIEELVQAFKESDGLFSQVEPNMNPRTARGPEPVFSYHGAKRLLLVNKDKYVPGRGVVHETGHSILKTAAYNAKNIDPSTGNYSTSWLRRVASAVPKETIEEFGTYLHAMTGLPELGSYEGNVPAGTMQIVNSKGHYTEIKSKLLVEEKIDLDNPAFHEARKAAMEGALERARLEQKTKKALDHLLDDTIGQKDVVEMKVLSHVLDEMLQYYGQPRRFYSASDVFDQVRAPRDIIQGVLEYMGERRHASFAADLETSGIRLKGKEDPNAPLIDKNGNFIGESTFFNGDTGEFVKIEALDDIWRQAVADSEMYSGQAIATLTPAKQKVIAELSGRTRYFNPVTGGMQLKNDKDLREMATADASAIISILDALPEDQKPARMATEKGMLVRLEDMPDAAWDAMAKAGILPAHEISELRGMAKVVSSVNAGIEYNNVFECSLAAASRQVGRGATTARLKGKDVPVTYRVFSPLSMELFLNTTDAKGNKLRVPEGGIRVHSYDVLALNKRMIGQYSRKEIRQYFNSYTHFADTLFSYIENNSRDASTRVPTETLFAPEFGKDAARVRDIMFETFGGKKPMDASYVNVPHEGYRKPGDDRLYPFYTMRWETMSEVRLRPERWNPNVNNKAFPYRHLEGYKPMTTNMMVSGFRELPKNNGSYLKDHNGYEIHSSKGGFKLFDPFGTLMGSFRTVKKAQREAEKHLLKADESDVRPATMPDADTTGLPSSGTSEPMRMISGVNPGSHYEPEHNKVMGMMPAAGIYARLLNLSTLAVDPLSLKGKGNYPGIGTDMRHPNSAPPAGGMASMADLVGLQKIKVYDQDIDLTALNVFLNDELVFGTDLNAGRSLPIQYTGSIDMSAGTKSTAGAFAISPSYLKKFSPQGAELYLKHALATEITQRAASKKGVQPQASRQEIEGLMTALGWLTGQSPQGGQLKTEAAKAQHLMTPEAVQKTRNANADIKASAQVITNNLTARGMIDLKALNGGKLDYTPEFVRATFAIKYDPAAPARLRAALQGRGISIAGKVDVMVNALSAFPGHTNRKFLEKYGHTMGTEVHLSDLLRELILDPNSPTKTDAGFLADMDALFASMGYQFKNGANFSAGINGKDLFNSYYGSGFSAFLERVDAFKQFLINEAGYRDGAWSENNLGSWTTSSKLLQVLHQNNNGTLFGSSLLPRVQAALLATAKDMATDKQRTAAISLEIGGKRVGKTPTIDFPMDWMLTPENIRFFTQKHLLDIAKDKGATVAERMQAQLIVAHFQNEDRPIGHVIRGGRGRVWDAYSGMDTFREAGMSGSYRFGDLPGQHIAMGGAERVVQGRPPIWTGAKNAVGSGSIYGVPLNMNQHEVPAVELQRMLQESMRDGKIEPRIEDSYNRISGEADAYRIHFLRAMQIVDADGNHINLPLVPGGKPTQIPRGANLSSMSDLVLKLFAAQSSANKTGKVYRLIDFANDIERSYAPNARKAESFLNAVDPNIVPLLKRVMQAPDYMDVDTRAAAMEYIIQKYSGSDVGLVTAAADLVVSEGTIRTRTDQSGAIFDVLDATSASLGSVGKMDMEKMQKVLKFYDAVKFSLESGVSANTKGPSGILAHMDKGVIQHVNRALGTDTGLGVYGRNKVGTLYDFATGQFVTRMVSGVEGLKNLSEERKQRLIEKGLIKLLTLGDGTTHRYFEISDATSELLVRNFEGKASKFMTKDTGLDPRDLAAMWLAQNGMLESGAYDAAEASKALTEHINKINEKSLLTLRDILHHPDLYEAYPALADVDIIFTNNPNGPLAGYNATKKAIQIEAGILLRDESVAILSNLDSVDVQTIPQYHDSLKMIVLHEIQHAVQHAEGWATAMPWFSTAFAGALDAYDRPSLATKEFAKAAPQYTRAARLLGSEKDLPLLADLRNDVRKKPPFKSVEEMKDEQGRQIYKLPYKAAIFNEMAIGYHNAQLYDSMRLSLRNYAELATFTDSYRPEIADYTPRAGTPKKVASEFFEFQEATPQQAVQALRDIIEAPKAVRIMQEAVPVARTFLRSMAMRAEIEAAFMGRHPASNADRINKVKRLISDISSREAEINSAVEAVKSGAMTHNELLNSLVNITDLKAAHGDLPADISHPSTAMSGIETGSMRVPESYLTRESLKVAQRLADISIELDKSNTSPTRAQLLIARLVDQMANTFYRDMDLEVMARETSERAFMSESQLQSEPRRINFKPEKGTPEFEAYKLGMWARGVLMDQLHSRDPNYKRPDNYIEGLSINRMVGGAGNSPMKVEFGENNLDLFAVALRKAARMALNSVFVQQLQPYASNGILHFSSRGWVYKDGKLTYEIRSGRLQSEQPKKIAATQLLPNDDTLASQRKNKFTIGTNPETGKEFIGDVSKAAESNAVAFMAGLSKDGETLTVEDVAKMHGLILSIESESKLESKVLDYVTKGDFPAKVRGGSLRSLLAEKGLSDESIRMSNIDKIDQRFAGVELTRAEIADIIALVHDVPFESVVERQNDIASAFKAMIKEKGARETGLGIYTSVKDDAFNMRAVNLMIAMMMGDYENWRDLTSYYNESLQASKEYARELNREFAVEDPELVPPGLMRFFRQQSKASTLSGSLAFVSALSTSLYITSHWWSALSTKLERTEAGQEVIKNFVDRAKKMFPDEHFRGGWVDMPIYAEKKIGAVRLSSDRGGANSSKIDYRNMRLLYRIQNHIMAVTPAAEKLAKHLYERFTEQGIEGNDMYVQMYQIVGDYLLGTLESSDLLNAHLSEMSRLSDSSFVNLAKDAVKTSGLWDAVTAKDQNRARRILAQGTPDEMPVSPIGIAHPYTSLASAADNYLGFTIGNYIGTAGIMKEIKSGRELFSDRQTGVVGYFSKEIIDGFGIELVPDGSALGKLASMPMTTSRLLEFLIESSYRDPSSSGGPTLIAHQQAIYAQQRLVQEAYKIFARLGDKDPAGSAKKGKNIRMLLGESVDERLVELGSLRDELREREGAEMFGMADPTEENITAARRLVANAIEGYGPNLWETSVKARAFLDLALEVSDVNIGAGMAQKGISGAQYRLELSHYPIETSSKLEQSSANADAANPVSMTGLISGYLDVPEVEGAKPRMVVTNILEPFIPPSRATFVFSDIAGYRSQKTAREMKTLMHPTHVKSLALTANIFSLPIEMGASETAGMVGKLAESFQSTSNRSENQFLGLANEANATYFWNGLMRNMGPPAAPKVWYRKLVHGMMGDNQIHMGLQKCITELEGARKTPETAALQAYFEKARRMVNDPAARALALRDDPLLWLIAPKGGLPTEAFSAMSQLPGYREAFYSSVLSAMSVLSLHSLADSRFPRVTANGIELSGAAVARRMQLSHESLVDLHRYTTGHPDAKYKPEQFLANMEAYGFGLSVQENGGIKIDPNSSAGRLAVASALAYLSTADGASRLADMAGHFMIQRFVIPKIQESTALSPRAKKALRIAIMESALESPHTHVHPYVDLAEYGSSGDLDSRIMLMKRDAVEGNTPTNGYARGNIATDVRHVRELFGAHLEAMFPDLLSSSAIRVLSESDGYDVKYKIPAELDSPVRHAESGEHTYVFLNDQTISGALYPESAYNGSFVDTMTASTVVQTNGMGTELWPSSPDGLGARQPQMRMLDNSMGGPYRKTIRPMHRAAPAELITKENGGALAALMSVSMDPSLMDTGFMPDISETTVQTPHPTLTDGMIRESIVKSIVDRATKLGSDTIDIAPPSETLSRVGPDVMQVVSDINSHNDKTARMFYANRGLRAGALASVSRYDTNKFEAGVSNPLVRSVLEHQETAPLKQGQGKGSGFVSDSKHRKGYAWRRLPDGSIMINVSGDHLGYKSAVPPGEIHWGFSLDDGIGFDPITGNVSPASYLTQSAFSDVLRSTGFSGASKFDPHSEAMTAAYRDSALARLGLAASETRRSLNKMFRLGQVEYAGGENLPWTFSTALASELLDRTSFTTIGNSGVFGKLDRSMARDGLTARRFNPFEKDDNFKYGPMSGADSATGTAMASAAISSQMRPGSYVTVILPPGATKDQIRSAIMDIHVDMAHNVAAHSAALLQPESGLSHRYLGNWGHRYAERGSGRKYQHLDIGFKGDLSYLQGVRGPDSLERNLRYVIERDPKLLEDVDSAVARILGQESSYFLPDTERSFMSTGDTGAAIATLFPGRSDMLEYSWDAKNAHGIKVWKRTMPKGANASNFAAHVVQTEAPVGMSVDGAIQIGPKAIAFKTDAEAVAFANRISAMSSRAAILKAFGGGDFEIVDRSIPNSQRGKLMPNAVTPRSISIDPVIISREIEMHNWVHGASITNDAHALSVGQAERGSSLGDAIIPYAHNSKEAKAIASAINSRKHVRLTNPGISISRMASGTSDLEALVRQKGNFGIPGGVIQYSSKAMHAICHGKILAGGTWKDFDSLTGLQWYKHLTSNGVSKDEIRQMGIGTLLANNKDIQLTRHDVAEFFAHMYPSIVRQDLQLTQSFYDMTMAAMGKHRTAMPGSPEYKITMPYPLSSEQVTRANQMRALEGLATRYEAIQSALDNLIDNKAGFDAEQIKRLSEIKKGFEEIALHTAEAHGITVDLSDKMTPADVFKVARQRVLQLAHKGVYDMTTKLTENDRAGEYNVSVGSPVLTEIRKLAGKSLSASQLEDFRLTFNAKAQAFRNALIGQEAMKGAFADIEPFIRYGMTDENILMMSDAASKHILIPSPAVTSPEGYAFGWPNKTMQSKKLKAVTSYFTSGQVINFEEYSGHPTYYSGPIHQTSHGVVRFATKEQIAELETYIEGLVQRHTNSTNPAEQQKLLNMIAAANSAKTARMLQQTSIRPGERHFGAYMQGQIFGEGQYEIGHIRKSHGILTSVVPLADLSGTNMLGTFGMERSNGIMDLASMPLTVIEEIQSDLFQGNAKIAEFTVPEGTSSLLTDPSQPDPVAGMIEVAKLRESRETVKGLVENASSAVVHDLLRQVLPAGESSVSGYGNIVSTGPATVSNVLRHTMMSNFDLLSRIANAPLMSPFMKHSGRTVAIPAGLRKQLEGLSNGRLPERLTVFEYDAALVGEVQRAAALLGFTETRGDMIGVGPVGIHYENGVPGLEKLAARVLQAMNSVNDEADRAGWNQIADAGRQSFGDLRKALTENPNDPVWVRKYIEAYRTVYSTYSQAAAEQIRKEAPALLKSYAQAASAGLPEGMPNHVISYLNAFGQNPPHAEYALAGLMGLAVVLDADMMARLPDIYRNPEGYNYEMLARRALENSRKFVADTRTLVGKTALTVFEDLMKIPSRDVAFDHPADLLALTKIGSLDLSHEMSHNSMFLRRDDYRSSMLASLRAIVDFHSGSYKPDKVKLHSLVWSWVSAFQRSRMNNELLSCLAEQGIMPTDARFIIRNPETSVHYGSPANAKTTISVPIEASALQGLTNHLADLISNHNSRQSVAEALWRMLEVGTISFFPQHKGSEAGQFAKSVVRSLFSLERAKTAGLELAQLDAKIAAAEKLLPESANRAEALSPSIPMIDDAGVAYKGTLFTNAILDSMNKGQRAVGWLDSSWQYSRGGSMMGEGGFVVLGAGPNRIPFKLETSAMPQLHALMQIAHGLFGDDIWSQLPSVAEMKQDESLRAVNSTNTRSTEAKVSRHAQRVVQDLVNAVEKKALELGWGDTSGEMATIRNLRAEVLNSPIAADMIMPGWHLVGDDGKTFKSKLNIHVAKEYINASAFMAEGNIVAMPNGFSGVPYGYTMNYGLQRAHARMMFPGASGKLVDLVSIDAFDRPQHTVTEVEGGKLHVVKSGDKLIHEELVLDSDAPSDVSQKLFRVRERILQNSKYRGNNPYVRRFINDWSASGGYLDFGFASGIRGGAEVEHSPGVSFGTMAAMDAARKGQVIPIGGTSGYPRLKPVGTDMAKIFEKGVMPQVESGSLTAPTHMKGLTPNEVADQAARDQFVISPGGRSVGSSSQIPMAYSSDNDVGGLRLLAAMAKAHGMGLEQWQYGMCWPVVTTFVHTPVNRTPAHVKAYHEKVTKGIPLMMITGSTKPDMSDKVNLARIAGFMKLPEYMRNPSYAPKQQQTDE